MENFCPPRKNPEALKNRNQKQRRTKLGHHPKIFGGYFRAVFFASQKSQPEQKRNVASGVD